MVATSLSYGECELGAGSSAALFYNDLWQQMAAEGITAVVSAGDSGSLGCDQNAANATNNLSTNVMSSTPYNISAGGTDFSDYYQTLATVAGGAAPTARDTARLCLIFRKCLGAPCVLIRCSCLTCSYRRHGFRNHLHALGDLQWCSRNG